ncbi:SIR2 family protein [Chloroflexi bacterium TSY]|nr:SIR2 family protein [Chloroflexi bacterium TSY]
MTSRRRRRRTTKVGWWPTIVERIKSGKVVPVISNVVSNDLVLGGHAALVEAYAKYTEYPHADMLNLPYLAQYDSITDEAIHDEWELKDDYIYFVKDRLRNIATANDLVEQKLKKKLEVVKEKLEEMSFSKICKELGYPRFKRGREDLFLALANCDLPIYLTTSYHGFLEVALRRAQKKPRIEVCRWHEGLTSIPSVFSEDYEPSVKEPLVYYLHGYDQYPQSLVLREDDYLKFLAAVRENVGRGTDAIPRRIRQALTESSLLLLGYDLRSWDFRVLFWGLIEPRPTFSRHTSAYVQLTPTGTDRNYVEKYLKKAANVDVYCGDIFQFCQQLHSSLEEQHE